MSWEPPGPYADAMVSPIPHAEVEVHAPLVRRLLRDQHPDLADRRLRRIGTGVGQRGVPAGVGPHGPRSASRPRGPAHRDGTSLGPAAGWCPAVAGAHPTSCRRTDRLLPLALGSLRPCPRADVPGRSLRRPRRPAGRPSPSQGSCAHCTFRLPPRRRAASSVVCRSIAAGSRWSQHCPACRAGCVSPSSGSGRRRSRLPHTREATGGCMAISTDSMSLPPVGGSPV